MSIKNIIKIFLLFFFLLNISCQKISNLKKKDEIVNITNTIENIEDNDTVSNFTKSYNPQYVDNYSSIIDFKWKSNSILEEKLILKNSIKKLPEPYELKFLIIDNQIYALSYDLVFKVYNFDDGEIIYENEINLVEKNEFFYPTSLAMINNTFYSAFSDGTIINFDTKGNIIWQKSFNDILKTSIKIYNNNIIILLSNKILSINPISGDVNWSFEYLSDIPVSSKGGNVSNNNNILYFILPNGRTGEINTIIGEPLNSSFSKLNLNQNLLNQNYSLHIFENYISLFENNSFLHTIDTNLDEILINKFKFKNVESHYFINNSLFILNKNRILKLYNIKNNNVFWSINLEEYISKKSKIVKIINNSKVFALLFSDGKILELDITSGQLTFEQKINSKNIYSINFYRDYIIINQLNGKSKFYIQ